jgi:hypothetical protein
MATLLTLPNELIAAICELEPISIPKLRLACRRMNEASIDSLIRHYFTKIDILTDDTSFGVLLEVAQHALFAPRIKTLGISRSRAIWHPSIPPVIGKKKEFSTDLARALRLLPNCRELVLNVDCHEFLGRGTKNPELQALRKFTHSTIDEDTYGIWHALQAIYLSGSNITKITSNVAIDAALWTEHMGQYPCAKLTLPSVKEFSGSISSSFDDMYDDHAEQPKKKHSCGLGSREAHDEHPYHTSALQSFLNHLPSLNTLHLHKALNGHIDNYPILLPPQLQILTLRTGHTAPYGFKELGTGVHGPRTLSKLKHLTWIIDYPVERSVIELFDEVSQLPALETFRIKWYTEAPKGYSYLEPKLLLPLTSEIPCLDSECNGKEFCAISFEWYTTDVNTDLSVWKHAIHDKRLWPDILEAVELEREYDLGNGIDDEAIAEYLEDYEDDLLELEDMWEEEGDDMFEY